MVDIKDSLSLSSKIDELAEFIGEENIGEDELADFKLRCQVSLVAHVHLWLSCYVI